VKGWENDPELVATFRAEVDERLTSLKAGLLKLEAHPSPAPARRPALPRRAHGQGLARMIGPGRRRLGAH
jgi:hypothetical protein